MRRSSENTIRQLSGNFLLEHVLELFGCVAEVLVLKMRVNICCRLIVGMAHKAHSDLGFNTSLVQHYDIVVLKILIRLSL